MQQRGSIFVAPLVLIQQFLIALYFNFRALCLMISQMININIEPTNEQNETDTKDKSMDDQKDIFVSWFFCHFYFRYPSWFLQIFRHISTTCCFFSLKKWHQLMQWNVNTWKKSQVNQNNAAWQDHTKQKRFMTIIVEDTRTMSCTFHCVGSRLLTIIPTKLQIWIFHVF